MTTVVVTKREIVEAIKTEPLLLAGGWLKPLSDEGSDGSYDESRVKDVKCSACAVGAVLRKVLSGTNTIEAVRSAAADAVNFGRYGGDWISEDEESQKAWLFKTAAERLKSDSETPMSVLSFVFESMAVYYQVEGGFGEITSAEKSRAVTTEFVRQHFPRTVKIDVGFAKPKRGVRVVSA